MLIDDIREVYFKVLEFRRSCVSNDDKEALDRVEQHLWRAQEAIAWPEMKAKFPRWEYRGPTADGRRPYYRLDDKAVLDDDYFAPYTVFVDDNGKALFIRANTIEEALRRAEGVE